MYPSIESCTISKSIWRHQWPPGTNVVWESNICACLWLYVKLFFLLVLCTSVCIHVCTLSYTGSVQPLENLENPWKLKRPLEILENPQIIWKFGMFLENPWVLDFWVSCASASMQFSLWALPNLWPCTGVTAFGLTWRETLPRGIPSYRSRKCKAYLRTPSFRRSLPGVNPHPCCMLLTGVSWHLAAWIRTMHATWFWLAYLRTLCYMDLTGVCYMILAGVSSHPICYMILTGVSSHPMLHDFDWRMSYLRTLYPPPMLHDFDWCIFAPYATCNDFDWRIFACTLCYM